MKKFSNEKSFMKLSVTFLNHHHKESINKKKIKKIKKIKNFCQLFLNPAYNIANHTQM